MISRVLIPTPYRAIARQGRIQLMCALVLVGGTELVDSSCPKWSPASDLFFSNERTLLHRNDWGGLLIRYAMELRVTNDSQQLRG